MCKRIKTTRRVLWGAGSSLWQVGRLTVVVAGLGLIFGAAFAAPDALGSTSSAATDEESLLIATRDAVCDQAPAADATAEDGQSLAPIPEQADRTPDLADETTASAASQDAEGAAQFGDALTKVARTQQSTKQPVVRRAIPVFQPAMFNGIQPGTSTRGDLIAAWGQPAGSISTDDGDVLTYHTEPFDAIDVLVSSDDVVAAVKIALAGSLEPEPLAKQLSLDKIDAVTVSDPQGVSLGQAFPERGVLFLFAALPEGSQTAPSSAVTHVVIQPLDAQAFVLRAESHLHGPYEKNIRDLEVAASLDPELSLAHWLLSEIYLATGQADLADAEATQALDLEPNNGAYQLRKSETLELLGQYDDAVQEVRAVLDREDVPPIVKAQALRAMARLAALGNAEIASKAMSFDNKAIELADQLATSENVKERHAAKELLVEAHLGIAGQIARQSYEDKLQSLGEWFSRASGLAEEFISNDAGSLELRLLVAREALAALASFKSTADPAPWVTEAKETADALLAECRDPLWQKQVQWELGTAYLQALKIEHARRQTAAALRYGQLAIENLAEGAKPRQAVHRTEQMVGELYFQIGAVHAIHNNDHQKAAQWYDKAVPLLTAKRPASELYSPRHEGEELVSMGVTYWQIGQKDHAKELTQAGAGLIEIAVEDRILAKSALSVPYGNLAAIHQQLGETTDAAKYAQLAKSARTAGAASDRPGTTKPNSASQRQVATSDTSSPTATTSGRQPSATRTPRRFSTARAGSSTSSQMR